MRILAFPAFSNRKTNPYQWLLYTHVGENLISEFSHKRGLTQKYDIFHIHWPDLYIKADSVMGKLKRVLLLGGVVTWMRLRGTKIVWTVHNLAPHDADHPALTDRFMHWFASRCDGLVFLSRSSAQSFYDKYNVSSRCRKTVISHGHYRDVYPAPPAKEDARRALDLPLDKKIVLFFGMIKPYKNAESLIENFKSLEDEDIFLLVAGSASPEMKQVLHDAAAEDPRIRIIIKFIPDEMVADFFAASDVVVLPFKNILNSGSLILALSFNRPVVAPAIGSLTELKEMTGPYWVRLYEGEFDQSVLRREIDSLKTNPSHDYDVCDLTALSWDKIGADTLAFYRSLSG